MTSIPSISRRAVWALALLASCIEPASAQLGDTPFDLRVVRSGARRVHLQILPLEVVSSQPDARTGAANLATRLVGDLVYSGFVAVREPLPAGVRYPRFTTDDAKVEAEKPADYAIQLSLEGERTDKMTWVAQLVVPESRKVVLAKRYSVDLADIDRPVHHLADAIVAETTGEQGIAQTRVIFSRGTGEERELYLIDYDGANLRRVTRNRSLNIAPRWSPGGDRVAYTSYYRGRQRLLILDGGSGQSTKIAEFDGLNIGACWSPDGGHLVVTLSRDGNPEIYRISPTGNIEQRLTFNDSIECSPYYDPSGNQIVFTSDRTGVPQIYVMDREGANRRRLTYEGTYNDSAVWSPRGDLIAYVSRREGRFQVFTIEPDGSNLRPITLPEDGDNEDPSWAPDGRHLVVTSDRTGRSALWVLDVESGEARPLTDGKDHDSTPHWSGSPAGS